MSFHLPATLRGFIWSVVNLSDDRGSPAWLLLTGNLQAFTQQVFDMLDLVKLPITSFVFTVTILSLIVARAGIPAAMCFR